MNIKKIGEPRVVMSNPGSIHRYFGWPTVTRLKNGRIALGASGFRLGHVCPFGKSVLSYSDDEGQTYTAPAPIIDTVLDDRDVGLCPFGESGLIFTSFNNSVEFQQKENEKRKEGPIKEYVNAYLNTVSPEAEKEALGLTFRVSYDNGLTFGPIYKSPITSPHGPLQRADGSILWVGTNYEGGCNIRAYDLDPQTGEMTLLGKIDTSGIRALEWIPCEPHAMELSDGTILCHIRTDCYKQGNRAFTLWQSESHDGGRTWTEPRRLLEPNGGAPSHLLRHSSGVIISTYSYRKAPFGIRAMISRDEGKTWEMAGQLYEGKDCDLGYPSTVELKDGSLLTAFYAGQDGAAAVLQQQWSLVSE